MGSEILKSWIKNAAEWNTIIDNDSIASRKYTNKAILDTITLLKLKKVADLGCGEGWLTRKMTETGIIAHGFDATPELITLARKKGGTTYDVLDFEAIENGQLLPNGPYDGAVFNFSIYQKEGLTLLLRQVLDNLSDNGTLLIQTLHPFYLQEHGFEYRSQWLSGSWKGLPGNFIDGHSWYARTWSDWNNLIASLPKVSCTAREVTNSDYKPISLLFTLKKYNGSI